MYERSVPRIPPNPPYDTEMICFAPKLFPYVMAGMLRKALPFFWDNPEDERTGRRLLYEQGAAMLEGCSKPIVQAVDRLYMLIDRNENGTLYTYTIDEETGDPVPSPAVPVVPNNPALYAAPGSKWQAEDMRDLLQNAITGALTADYTNPRGTNVVLEDILAALNAETNEETIALLQKIVITLGGII